MLDGQLTTGGLAACSILSGRAVAPLSALVGVRIKLNSIHSANQAIEKLSDLSLSEPSDSEQPKLLYLTLRRWKLSKRPLKDTVNSLMLMSH